MIKKLIFSMLIGCSLVLGAAFADTAPKQVVFVPDQGQQKDISGHWAESTIRKIIGLNLMGGYIDNTFRPKQNVTREEATAIIVRLLGDPSVSSSFMFDDVKGRWSEAVVKQGLGIGLIDPTEQKIFEPTKPITRGEVAVMMQRALKYKKVQFVPNTNAFYDLVNKRNAKEIQDVVALGIMGGYQDGTFKPQGTITRAELASVVLRGYELLNKAEVKVIGLDG